MKYEVSNPASGASLGVFEAESPSEAIEACCREAGYQSKAHAEEVTGTPHELTATLVTVVVQVAHEVPPEAVARIEALLDKTALWDPDWSGAEFEIVRGDYTCLPDANTLKGAQLFSGIQRAILGLTEEPEAWEE